MGFAFCVGSGAFGGSRLSKTLLRHFGVSAGEIATSGRQFPITARVDIQSALEDLLRNRPGTKLLGILSPNPHEPPALAHTLAGRHSPPYIGTDSQSRRGGDEPVATPPMEHRLWHLRDQTCPSPSLGMSHA